MSWKSYSSSPEGSASPRSALSLHGVTDYQLAMDLDKEEGFVLEEKSEDGMEMATNVAEWTDSEDENNFDDSSEDAVVAAWLRRNTRSRRPVYSRKTGTITYDQDSILDIKSTEVMKKMVSRGAVDQVYGCVRSFKNSHIYLALGTDEETYRQGLYAAKVFTDPSNGMVSSHKEFRCLIRAAKCIRAPAPLAIKEHIVVMSFIGDADGKPAPTLKEAKLTLTQLQFAYVDLVQALRKLFQQARLVHGDLSEYNVLYQHQKCWLIDFGQAVDRTHPEVLTYLRRDLRNLFQFFRRQGLPDATPDSPFGILSKETAYAFITRTECPDDVLHMYPKLPFDRKQLERVRFRRKQ
ncbi:hypothetical protein Poli38472_013389 [Pythium oligandrum]|uniref:non-specific serine/threonine protein kinase n=1 Tax=Pythium oligandrum TaxID=41045 RepID=A0A8K1FC44_PYTOL|nr:hypothetical protein Poli38472_013389 [Pythium oligandrum]|eukprot:TMW57915.1 hypothetical protein Poli38472_013389 [Pythium oligandrum]